MPMFGSIKECLLVQKAMRDAKFRRCFRAQWPQTPSQWPVTIPMTNSSIEVANGWGDWLRGPVLKPFITPLEPGL